MGCGCGIVGIMAYLTRAASSIVCTDKDAKTVQLCAENIDINQREYSSAEEISTRVLEWGDISGAEAIMRAFLHSKSNSGANIASSGHNFDTIIAADILYPATSGRALDLLFQTVQFILKEDGKFFLSFISRDGHQTILRLLEVASDAGFRISCIQNNTFLPPVKSCRPMMGAKLLLLTRSADAKTFNCALGGANCFIFPGLLESASRALDDSSEDEWEPPFHGINFADGDLI